MNVTNTEPFDRWLRFPRVILMYIPLYAMVAVPMFTSDPANPARAFSFALMMWILLTAVSGVVALVIGGLVAYLHDRRLFVPVFNATFVVTWIVVFGGIFLTASNG